MTTTVKHRLKALRLFRRHPWRVAAGLIVVVVVAGIGGYALLFFHHFHAAEQAVARYDFEEAQDHLATCIRLWPHRGDLHLLAARAARRAGRLTEATEHLDECQRLDGKTPENLLEYAMLRAQQGDFRNSGKYLLSLLEDNPPEAPLILEALALGTYRVYMLGASRNYAEKAIQLEPGNVPMLLLLARLYDGRVRFADAEKYYRAAVEAQQGHAEARLELAQFLLRLNKFDESADNLEQLRNRRFRMPEVLMGLALCRRQQGQTEEERELLDSLLLESPDNPEALAERGRLELEAGELNAAERDLRSALAKRPCDRQAILNLAQCLDRRGKNDEGAAFTAKLAQLEDDRKSLEKLIDEIAKKPNDVEMHRQAGLICQRIGRDHDAERWLLGALQIDQHHKPTYESLADFYTHVGRLELAAQYRQGAR
jgi:tetratricopeptide (TPR) repeat protein